MDFEHWLDIVQHAAAIRRIRRMQPAGGIGDKLFPPTYPGEGSGKPPRHVFEFRRIGSSNAQCVLIDSVQSQANRLEEALGQLRTRGLLDFPVIAVDFSASNDLADIGTIDTLQAPHRVFDAIVRDSIMNGKPFDQSDEGQALVRARPDAASAIYALSPSALVFGAWNSTGQGGGLGAKFPRAIVSEIIGIGVATDADDKPSGQRTGSRIDPLGIRSAVRVYKRAGTDDDWTVVESEAEQGKSGAAQGKSGAALYVGKKKTGQSGRPSLINHGNVTPTVDTLGVSVDYVQHTFVLSLPALRRLHFIARPGTVDQADRAAHAALAALALAACLSQDQTGYALRSRCDLIPEAGQADEFELVQANGDTHPLGLDLAKVCSLFRQSVETAALEGLPMRGAGLVLQPQDKLLELVRRSRQLALRGEAEPEE